MTKSQCIANHCGAARPRINGVGFSGLEEQVQVRLKELGMDKGTFKRCAYCGTLWAEYFDMETDRFIKKEIGVTDLGSDKINWLI